MKLIKLFSILLINIVFMSTAFAAIGYTGFKASEDRQSFSISLYGGYFRNTYYLQYYDSNNNLRQQVKLCQASGKSTWCRATVKYSELPKFNKEDYIVFVNFLMASYGVFLQIFFKLLYCFIVDFILWCKFWSFNLSQKCKR